MLWSNQTNSALSAQHSALFYWLPSILWMAAIFIFSTDQFSGEQTGGRFFRLFQWLIPSLTEAQFAPWHFLIRKAAHFTEYAILALLLFRAFRAGAPAHWQRNWALGSLAIVIAYALLDEYHQTWTAHRFGSVYDSSFDTAGAAAALMALWWRRSARRNQKSKGKNPK